MVGWLVAKVCLFFVLRSRPIQSFPEYELLGLLERLDHATPFLCVSLSCFGLVWIRLKLELCRDDRFQLERGRRVVLSFLQVQGLGGALLLVVFQLLAG